MAWLGLVPRVLLAGLLLLAIVNLLAGVLLRYVVVRITDVFDWPTVDFFWVEEVGEFTLAWLTLIGAAVGISDRVHFAIGLGVHRLPLRARTALDRVLHVGIAAFGVAAAVSGWRLSVSNSQLTSPGLGINLGWLYFSCVVGGTLIAVYALRIVLGFAHRVEHPDLGGH
jgi:TRAP-type C4-dicarboxylate transport system permease small subunit